MDDVLNKLSEKLGELTRRGEELLKDEQVQEQLTKIKEGGKDMITKYPVGSIVAGVAIGFLLGKIFTNDDD